MCKIFIVTQNTFFKHAIETGLDSAAFHLAGAIGHVRKLSVPNQSQLTRSDLVLVDTPNITPQFLTHLRLALQVHAGLKCIVITAECALSDITTLFEMGCYGVLTPRTPIETLGLYLQLVLNGQRVMPAEVVDEVRTLKAHNPAMRAKAFFKSLTKREGAILNILLEGWQNKQIAHHLNVPLTTVKADLKSIMRKTGTQNRTELAIAALRTGWLETAQSLSPA